MLPDLQAPRKRWKPGFDWWMNLWRHVQRAKVKGDQRTTIVRETPSGYVVSALFPESFDHSEARIIAKITVNHGDGTYSGDQQSNTAGTFANFADQPLTFDSGNNGVLREFNGSTDVQVGKYVEVIKLYDVNGDPQWYFAAPGSDGQEAEAIGCSSPASENEVDSSVSSNMGCAVIVADGNPAIAYNGSGFDVDFVRGSDKVGYEWGSPTSVASSGTLYKELDAADIGGNPAIVYMEDGPDANENLYYVRATNAQGSAWGSPITIESSSGVQVNVDKMRLLEVDGRPAVVWLRQDGGTTYDLKYLRADDATGSAWTGTPATIASSVMGASIGFAVVAGNPAVCYVANGTANTRYRRASDAAGSSWGTIHTVTNNASSGGGATLTEFNDLPLVFSQVNTDLYASLGDDVAGSGFSKSILAGSYSGAPKNLRAGIAQDLPWVACIVNSTSVRVLVAYCADLYAWNETTVASAISSSRLGAATVDGAPAVAFANSGSYLEYHKLGFGINWTTK